ncbi:hypothetical protein UY3_14140 [Chelonia mydas]|uniref:Uncharacterized protein n=1 Tax=Chelonia mydas TaxID=8469 RepID=M7AVL1_CHEMY|nr:hypothetical protein UY3_14140 [Chelonia mydas]
MGEQQQQSTHHGEDATPIKVEQEATLGKHLPPSVQARYSSTSSFAIATTRTGLLADKLLRIISGFISPPGYIEYCWISTTRDSCAVWAGCQGMTAPLLLFISCSC